MIDPSIIGAVSNAMRGGQWKAFVPVKFHWIPSDAINATIFMLTVMHYTGDLYLSLASFAAMWIGAMPGWGDYIGALGGWRKDDLEENIVIDKLIDCFRRWPRWWGFIGLALRGLFWGACLSIPFFVFGHDAIGGRFFLIGLFMGAVYGMALYYTKSRIGHASEWQGMGWGLGEILWGYVLWGALNGYSF